MSDLILVQENSTPETVELVSAGPQGPSGTFTIGTITTGLAGSSANVTNTGTPSQAVLNFTIPRGDVGDVTPEATAAKNAAQSASSAAAASQVVASNAATSATASASSAQQSATAAASSSSTATSKAAEASTSAASAASSESVALGASSTATLKASEAGSFATAASTSAASSETSANASASYAAAASGSANASATSAGNASGSASLAQEWATKTISEVALGQGYGAKKYALDAASMAAAAEIAAAGSLVHSQTAAGHSQSASTSADNANTSASVSSDASVLATLRAGQAAESASTSSSQAANASASAATATSQASSATASASIASTQAGIATTKASEAATSASAASVSAAAALASQTASAGSAAAANTSAGSAAGSASSALAIYGTTNAQQAALVAAQSAASLAQGFALSASSAIQQDLSGVTAQALHRSPNAVTAMSVYDTSKDSDGGAWTEKCQHTSWYNEALNGKWLGAQTSEFDARNVGATVGPELVTNGGFSSGTAGWTAAGTASLAAVAGELRVTASSNYDAASQNLTTVVGKYYVVTGFWRVISGTSVVRITGPAGVSLGSTSSTTLVPFRLFFTATATTTSLGLASNFPTPAVVGFSNISVREVTALTTASGDYYQSTVDGKFYRLWKNLLKHSADFSNALWSKNNGATVAAQGNAWRITDPGDTASHISQSLSGLPSNGQYSFQIDFERQASGIFVVGLQNFWCYVNHATLTTLNETYYQGSNASSSCVVLSGTRCRLTVTLNHVAPNTFAIYPALGQMGGDVNATVARTATGYLDVYSAQLEYGSTATAYEVKTVDGSITETFRGNKADFPRLAGIVAETGNLTIYDLTEAGRPMWMRFTGTGFLRYSATSVGLCALNGSLLGANGDWGVYSFDFAKDKANFRNNGGLYSWTRPELSARHSSSTNYFAAVNSGQILSSIVNAVAMTVLPDAPVDAVTGLQVPTIAVATAGGISVIKHNGAVVNSASTSGYGSVSLRKSLLFASAHPSVGTFTVYAPNPGLLGASFAVTTLGATIAPDFVKTSSYNKLVELSWNTYSRMTQGAVNLLRSNEAIFGKGVGATVTPTFNTGHLVGDIRRAYLSDVDVGSVSGTELVTNGGFDTDSDWYKSNATISGGAVNYTALGGYVSQLLSGVVAGKRYQVTVSYTNIPPNNGGGYIGFNSAQDVNSNVWGGNTASTRFSGTGTSTYHFTPSAGQIYFGICQTTFGGLGSIESISVKEVVYDRSYKSAIALITGTLTKTQVALGSQLVAYSGFSA